MISDLWRFVKSKDDDDEDDGFGPKGAAPKRKTKVEEKETLNFKLFMKMSGEACSSKTLNCAPVVYYEKSKFPAPKNRKFNDLVFHKFFFHRGAKQRAHSNKD